MPYGKFVGFDTATQGNWRKRYGKQGYIFPTAPGGVLQDNILVPSWGDGVSGYSSGSLTKTAIVADGPIASNPLGLVYPDGSAASGAAYPETTASTQDYIRFNCTTTSNTAYRFSTYAACLDGLTRTMTLSVLFSLTILDTYTLTLGPGQSVWAQFIFRPTDSRFSRAGVTFTSGTPGIINGVFMDLYKPDSIGGFGFPFLGSHGF